MLFQIKHNIDSNTLAKEIASIATQIVDAKLQEKNGMAVETKEISKDVATAIDQSALLLAIEEQAKTTCKSYVCAFIRLMGDAKAISKEKAKKILEEFNQYATPRGEK